MSIIKKSLVGCTFAALMGLASPGYAGDVNGKQLNAEANALKTISFSDLDLQSESGRDALDKRIKIAVNDFCRSDHIHEGGRKDFRRFSRKVYDCRRVVDAEIRPQIKLAIEKSRKLNSNTRMAELADK